MDFSEDDLREAKRQIDSVIRKLEQTLDTLESKEDPSKCRSQITLTRRRLKAFRIATILIEKEMNL